jgi:hypothetical protein
VSGRLLRRRPGPGPGSASEPAIIQVTRTGPAAQIAARPGAFVLDQVHLQKQRCEFVHDPVRIKKSRRIYIATSYRRHVYAPNMAHPIPIDQILLVKGIRRQDAEIDVVNLATRITPCPTYVKVKSDLYSAHPDFNQMAYIGFASSSQLPLAKTSLITAINQLRAEGENMNLSWVVVVKLTDLESHLHQSWFTLWVGNIHDANEEHIRRLFARFLANQPRSRRDVVIHTSWTGKRYAFVNIMTYENARAALRWSSEHDITFGPDAPAPADVRPRGRLQFVREVLIALRRSPDHLLSLADAERIAESLSVAGGPGLIRWMLRGMSRHLAIDDATGAISPASPPEAHAEGPAAAAPAQAQDGRGPLTAAESESEPPPAAPGASIPADEAAAVAAANDTLARPLAPAGEGLTAPPTGSTTRQLPAAGSASAPPAAVPGAELPSTDAAAAAAAVGVPAAMGDPAAGGGAGPGAGGGAGGQAWRCGVCWSTEEEIDGVGKAALLCSLARGVGHTFCRTCCEGVMASSRRCPTCRAGVRGVLRLF